MNKQEVFKNMLTVLFMGIVFLSVETRTESAASKYVQKVEKERDEDLRDYMGNMGSIGYQNRKANQHRAEPKRVAPKTRPVNTVNPRLVPTLGVPVPGQLPGQLRDPQLPAQIPGSPLY